MKRGNIEKSKSGFNDVDIINEYLERNCSVSEVEAKQEVNIIDLDSVSTINIEQLATVDLVIPKPLTEFDKHKSSTEEQICLASVDLKNENVNSLNSSLTDTNPNELIENFTSFMKALDQDRKLADTAIKLDLNELGKINHKENFCKLTSFNAIDIRKTPTLGPDIDFPEAENNIYNNASEKIYEDNLSQRDDLRTAIFKDFSESETLVSLGEFENLIAYSESQNAEVSHKNLDQQHCILQNLSQNLNLEDTKIKIFDLAYSNKPENQFINEPKCVDLSDTKQEFKGELAESHKTKPESNTKESFSTNYKKLLNLTPQTQISKAQDGRNLINVLDKKIILEVANLDKTNKLSKRRKNSGAIKRNFIDCEHSQVDVIDYNLIYELNPPRKDTKKFTCEEIEDSAVDFLENMHFDGTKEANDQITVKNRVFLSRQREIIKIDHITVPKDYESKIIYGILQDNTLGLEFGKCLITITGEKIACHGSDLSEDICVDAVPITSNTDFSSDSVNYECPLDKIKIFVVISDSIYKKSWTCCNMKKVNTSSLIEITDATLYRVSTGENSNFLFVGIDNCPKTIEIKSFDFVIKHNCSYFVLRAKDRYLYLKWLNVILFKIRNRLSQLN